MAATAGTKDQITQQVHDGESSPVASAHDMKRQPSNSSDDEPRPHLHYKTYLAIFAICLIYFAHIYNVVGAGAVR